MKKRIVETCNFDSDYPDEKFLNVPPLPDHAAQRIADTINASLQPDHPRYWKVVDVDYKLQPGFKP